MKLFKEGSFVEEIMNDMQKNMVKRTAEEEYGLSKLAEAVDNLNSAAEILESAGLDIYAEEITNILEKLASLKINGKK